MYWYIHIKLEIKKKLDRWILFQWDNERRRKFLIFVGILNYEYKFVCNLLFIILYVEKDICALRKMLLFDVYIYNLSLHEISFENIIR